MVIESPLTSNILKHQIMPFIMQNKEKKNKIETIVKSQEIQNKIVQKLRLHESEVINFQLEEMLQ